MNMLFYNTISGRVWKLPLNIACLFVLPCRSLNESGQTSWAKLSSGAKPDALCVLLLHIGSTLLGFGLAKKNIGDICLRSGNSNPWLALRKVHQRLVEFRHKTMWLI